MFMTDVFYEGTELLLHQKEELSVRDRCVLWGDRVIAPQKEELSVHDRCVLWGDRVIAPPEGRTECS